jgi:hypothetical protein
MKKLAILFFALQLMVASIHAQSTKPAIIEGTNGRDLKGPLILFKVEEGEKVECASSKLYADGKFAFCRAQLSGGLLLYQRYILSVA